MYKVEFCLDDLDDDHLHGTLLSEEVKLTNLPNIGHEVFYEPLILKWKLLKNKGEEFQSHPQSFVVTRVVLDVGGDCYNVWLSVPNFSLQFT